MCQQNKAPGESVAMTGVRRSTRRAGSTRSLFVAAVLSTVSVAAQQPEDSPIMVLVPADRIRAMEASQRSVTGLLKAAFEDVEAADELLGRKVDLEPLLDTIANAGRESNDLATPSRETTEGLTVPLIGFCSADPESAWTRAAVRSGHFAGNRIGELVGLVESFNLDEARRAVASSRKELEAAEGIPEGAEELLAQAESHLLRAARVYEVGVVNPFAESFAGGVARMQDRSAVSELCRLQAGEVQADRRDGVETPDLDLAQATRTGALNAIQASLAALDAVVLPEDLSMPGVARAFEGPVQKKSVAPKYPNFARWACMEGEVLLDLKIDRDGVPRRILALRGLPELAESAIAAAEQWRFRPAALDGEPVAFDYRLAVNFVLKGAEALRCRRVRAN